MLSPSITAALLSCLFQSSSTPNARQAFDQRHLREAVVPAAVKCWRQAKTTGLPIVRVEASVIEWHLEGPSPPRSCGRQLNGDVKSPTDCGPE